MSRRREIRDTEYYVLNALAREPLYGYAIRKEIEQLTEGRKRLSVATLYDTLHRLFQDRLIEREPDELVDGRVRRMYKITGAGRQALSERFHTMELLQSIHRLNVAGGEA